MRTGKELLEEIKILESQLKEVEKDIQELVAQEEQIDEDLAKEKNNITIAQASIKNLVRKKRKVRREKKELEAVKSRIKRNITLKKKELDKIKKELLESLKEKKDYSTEKYGPDYLTDLSNILLENGNGNKNDRTRT